MSLAEGNHHSSYLLILSSFYALTFAVKINAFIIL